MEAAYSPNIAEHKYQEDLRAKRPDLKIGNDYEFARYLKTTMTEKECSPAAALGYAQNKEKQFNTTVHDPAVYSYIKKGVFLNLSQKDLDLIKKSCIKKMGSSPVCVGKKRVS